MSAPVQHPDLNALGQIGRREPATPAKPKGPTAAEQLATAERARDDAIQRATAAEGLVKDALGRPAPQAAAPQPVQVNIPPDPGEMPDPNTNSQEFQQWIYARDARQAAIHNANAVQLRDDAVRGARSDAVIDAFMSRHPGHGPEHRELVVAAMNASMKGLGLAAIPVDTTALEAGAVTLLGWKGTAAPAAGDPAQATGDGGEIPPASGAEPSRTAGVSSGSANRATDPHTVPGEEDGVEIVPFNEQFQRVQAETPFF